MSSSKRPDYDVLMSKQVEGGDGESKNYYTKIGAGWNVSKGGISINLDAYPTNGQIVLFPQKVNAGSKTETKETAEAT